MAGRAYTFCSLILLLRLLYFSGWVSAEVVMQDCQLDENIYVLTLDNADQVADEEAAMHTLRRIYKERGRSPAWMGMDAWAQVESYYAYNDSGMQTSRIALIVDPYDQNISLVLVSDHQVQHSAWFTDNLSFIDGKSNAGADFRCTGNRVHLRWRGRDLASGVEHFDSSEGELVAEVAGFTNTVGQSGMQLEIQKLHFRYPRTGLSGMAGSFWHAWIRRKTPHPHTFLYDADVQGLGSGALIMGAKYTSGYQAMDRERLALDSGRLEESRDESWSQNFLSPTLPMTLSSIRSHLDHARTLLRNEATLFAHSVLGVPALKSYIDEADRHIEQGLSDEGGGDIHFVNAQQQLAELSSRLKQNRAMTANSGKDIEVVASRIRQVQEVADQAERMLEAVSSRLRAETRRRQRLLRSSIDGRQVSRAQVRTEGEESLSSLVLADGASASFSAGEDGYPAAGQDRELAGQDRELDACVMTSAGLEGIFTASVGDTHYGFDVGQEVRLLGDHWIMTLESTRTPWTMTGLQTYGTDYVIPRQYTWCRGSLFGVDYAKDSIRLTARGVYDSVNNRIYLVSQWSLWSQPKVFGWVQGVTAGLLFPGAVLIGSALASAVGAPAAFALMSGSLGLSLAAMPWSPPEVHFPHIRFLGRKLADWGLGEAWYTGSASLDYYSYFATLVPKSSFE
ncbi:MAG: hypothetical protein OXC07_09450 [Kistimonas sp.]|nr:hypothetical protein [Kistimonas sp.]